MPRTNAFVIVAGGLSAGKEDLREHGPDGHFLVIGDERERPCTRPPLMLPAHARPTGARS